MQALQLLPPVVFRYMWKQNIMRDKKVTPLKLSLESQILTRIGILQGFIESLQPVSNFGSRFMNFKTLIPTSFHEDMCLSYFFNSIVYISFT